MTDWTKPILQSRHTRHYAGMRLALLLSLIVGPLCSSAPADEEKRVAKLREPVAAVWIDDGETLAVANRRCGTVSLIGMASRRVASETLVAEELSDLAALPNGRGLLVSDFTRHELLLLQQDGGKLRVAGRVKTDRHPQSVIVSPDGLTAYVACLWSRRLDVVALGEKLQVTQRIDLPFAPRKLSLLPRQMKLIVADAFGGKLGVTDLAVGKLELVRTLPGHNIRGLKVSDDGHRLLVSYQFLNSLVRINRQAIGWGGLINNVVRGLSVERLLDPDVDVLADSHWRQLDEIGRGAADPAGLALLKQQRLIVALAGVQQLAVVELVSGLTQRIDVGRRPTAVIVHPDGLRAFVLNSHSDSISEINLKRGQVSGEISLGEPPVETPVLRGERLFYDARLSHESWLSCHSCHTDGHTSGQLADTQGDGSFGAPKRVLSLLGVADTDPWAWNGSIRELHHQIDKSVTTTMQGSSLRPRQIDDLVSFLHTLKAPPPHKPSHGLTESEPDREQIQRGQAVFTKNGCSECHVPPLTYTTQGVYDVGLTDEAGNHKFNPPSLRGVGQQDRLLHDGRARSLEEVFTDHGHQLRQELSDKELKDLVRFLRSL